MNHSGGDAAVGNTRWPLYLAGFLAVTAVCFLLDGPVYRFVHEHYNYYTRPVPTHMKLVTRVLRSLEDWGENVFILFVAYAMWRLDRHHRSRVACLAVAAIVVALAVEGVKRFTGRERPQVSQGETVFHGPAKWNHDEQDGRDRGDYQSFPSGHTSSAAAYSGCLAAFYPPLRPACIALAAGCGANRIWKERHFLSDCWVAGVFGFWFGFTLPRRRSIAPLLGWFDRRFSLPVPEPARERPTRGTPDRSAT